MSFVYAFKSNNSIYMIGDTKVIIDDKYGVVNFRSKRECVEKYGILKTVILSDSIALGFASNNLRDVDEALRSICNNALSLKNIIKILTDYSRKCNGASEFILTYSNEYIYSIKNGFAEERENCYVGSYECFRALQWQRNNRPISPDIIFPLIRTMIRSNIDPKVGGFCTELKYNNDEQKFEYIEKISSTTTITKTIPSGGTLPLTGSAEDGGFTYATFPFRNEDAFQYLALHMYQLNKTYVYVPLLNMPPCDCELKYLFIPFDISDRI